MTDLRKSNPEFNLARKVLSGFGEAKEVEAEVNLSEITPDRELDVTGEVCPYPVIAVQKELIRMEPGEILVEVTDHTISTHTVPDAVKEKKLAEVLGIEESSPGLYRIYLKKS